MNDDDVTRVMDVPFPLREQWSRRNERAINELARGGMEPADAQIDIAQSDFTPRDLAQTPCVGVSSMGNTHFGETRFGAESVQHERSQPQLSASVKHASTDNQHERSSTVPAMRRRRAQDAAFGVLQMFETSRPLSLIVGLCVGVMAALLVVLFGRAEKAAPSVVVRQPVSLRVIAKESGVDPQQPTRGISSVAVRAGHQVIVTDDDGVAEFSGLTQDAPLLVEATCPEGYSGGRLSRTLTPAVLRSSTSWLLELVCEPEFVQVDIVVKAEGCGEMNVLIDHVAVGVTQSGYFRTSSRTFGEAAIELEVDAVTGACELDRVRTLALTRSQPVVEVLFHGQRPKPQRVRRIAPASAPRPYRL